MSRRRTFLFLQGVCSPFFVRLARRLMADGHRVFKINFNAGDWVYWGGRSAWNYRGKVSSLRDYLDGKYRKFGITDQVLFGDRRPVNRPAVEHGESCGVRTHVFEEGYFRPHWVTLEREGVNGHSLLPRDPAWFWEAGARLPATRPVEPFQSPFRIRAFHDVFYHGNGVWNPIFYPGYRTHATVAAPVEYAGYIKRFSMLRFHQKRDDELIMRLAERNLPFYLLPLQLNSDAQIRDHSRFDGMAGVMEHVMASFAHFAPGKARLVIKNHPLDTGLANYPGIIAGLEKRFGLSGRVDYLETGNLDLLLQHAQGVVTVNSTVGTLSLGFGCPTITLSDPVYNLPGLTFQGSLDDFWQAGEKPDAGLFQRFRAILIHTTQVNGGFYCCRGINLAVENSLQFLEAERPAWETLL